MHRFALMLLLALVLAGCGDPATQGPVVDSSDSTEQASLPEPPRDAFSPLASLMPSTVEPGTRTTEIQITAPNSELNSGTIFRVERWDGDAWQLHHYAAYGRVIPPDTEEFGAVGTFIEPGQTLTEEVALADLQVGVYRIGREMWTIDGGPDNQMQVYARLDVHPRQPGSPTVQGTDLDGTEWRSTTVHGLDLPADQRIALTFRGGGVGVEAACNRLGGPYELVEGRLVVDEGELWSTRIGCPEPEATWDNWIADLLVTNPTVVIDEQGLTLSAGQDTVIFEHHIEPTPTATDANAPLSSWVPPPDYRYTITGSCNSARFHGEMEMTVRDGTPSSQVAHLLNLIADAEAVRAEDPDVVRVEHDPESGHPTQIIWDIEIDSSTDSEACYTVLDYEVLDPQTTDPLPITTAEPCPPDASCVRSIFIDGRSYEPTCGLVDAAVVTDEVYATGMGYTVNVIDGVDPAVLLAWDAPQQCGRPLEGRWHGLIATGVIGSDAYNDAWCHASVHGSNPEERINC